MIADGRVRVAGAMSANPARLVAAAEPIDVRPPPARYVGRGGEKLRGALDRFDIDVAGRVALDVGSSTGGFTDCLVQAGAAHVTAVDVGRHQIHDRIARHARVEVREHTDIRSVVPASLVPLPDLVVADVSFLSLTVVVTTLVPLSAVGADWILLVKPQFEAPRPVVDAGRGVVRDQQTWRGAIERVASAVDDAGAAIMGAMVSPLRGASGNVEFLLHARAPGGPGAVRPLDLDALVAEAEPPT